MSYIYETHAHTVLASACGKSYGSEYISFYKSLGYHGIIMTDHFFNGNCAIPKDLPWEERVELFCKGYEEAKAEHDAGNHTTSCGYVEAVEAQEAVYEWITTAPTAVGSYEVRAYLTAENAGEKA